MLEELALYKELLTDTTDEEFKHLSRELCKTNLFYLLTQVCKRKDMLHQWIYERCVEVQDSSDEHLDLWFRAGYKSSIITFGLTIQDILKDPNITVCIFSHTKGIAKAFLSQIKLEFETNKLLVSLFPEIFWDKPSVEAPRWSVDNGIVVKRTANPKESTVEATGLVDSAPVSRHYSLRVYDDAVTRDSVSTTDQIKKVLESWELSLNLGTEHGTSRYIGTRYAFNDLYYTIMEREVVTPRLHPATKNGQLDGETVYLSKEQLEKKYREMGPYTYSAQMLLKPIAEELQSFKKPWLQYWSPKEGHGILNVYLLVDPANAKKKDSNYTVIWVIGLATDNNYYVLDMYRDRLDLHERVELLFKLHREYKPKAVIYEKYGKDTDIDHIEYVQTQEHYRFQITPTTRRMKKEDRIRTLVSVFADHRIYLPREKDVTHYDYQKKPYDPITNFVNDEYLTFPVCQYDDALDSLSQLTDKELNLKFPNMDTNYMKPMESNDYDVLNL
jgi:predicted phage terminase large subunit-like protein